MVIINVHPSTEDKGYDEKEKLYATLEDVYDFLTEIIKIIVKN